MVNKHESLKGVQKLSFFITLGRRNQLPLTGTTKCSVASASESVSYNTSLDISILSE